MVRINSVAVEVKAFSSQYLAISDKLITKRCRSILRTRLGIISSPRELQGWWLKPRKRSALSVSAFFLYLQLASACLLFVSTLQFFSSLHLILFSPPNIYTNICTKRAPLLKSQYLFALQHECLALFFLPSLSKLGRVLATKNLQQETIWGNLKLVEIFELLSGKIFSLWKNPQPCGQNRWHEGESSEIQLTLENLSINPRLEFPEN